MNPPKCYAPFLHFPYSLQPPSLHAFCPWGSYSPQHYHFDGQRELPPTFSQAEKLLRSNPMCCGPLKFTAKMSFCRHDAEKIAVGTYMVGKGQEERLAADAVIQIWTDFHLFVIKVLLRHVHPFLLMVAPRLKTNWFRKSLGSNHNELWHPNEGT